MHNLYTKSDFKYKHKRLNTGSHMFIKKKIKVDGKAAYWLPLSSHVCPSTHTFGRNPAVSYTQWRVGVGLILVLFCQRRRSERDTSVPTFHRSAARFEILAAWTRTLNGSQLCGSSFVSFLSVRPVVCHRLQGPWGGKPLFMRTAKWSRILLWIRCQWTPETQRGRFFKARSGIPFSVGFP